MTTNATLTRPASWQEFQERQESIHPLHAESMKRGLAFQPQASDVFITPFGKCGTTWLQQIVQSLRTRGDMNFTDISEVMPWLEQSHYLGIDMDTPQPGTFRAFKSHRSWNMIPKGARYIVSFRNPKDALVSWYNFVNGYIWQTNSVSISKFAREQYLSYQGDSWDRSYWGHLVSWWEQRENPQVLLLCYEKMKTDLHGTVRTIAEFLEIELDEDLFEIVVKQSSLDFMKEHKSKFSDLLLQQAHIKNNYLPPSDTFVKVKNGRVGDHRTQLPDDIAAEMDAIWQESVTPRTGLASYDDLRTEMSSLPNNVSAEVVQQFLDGDYAERFESVYKHADQNPDVIPWANATTHPRLVEWLEKNDLQSNDRCAIVLGCGLGDDAEKLAELGFQVTAFDVSPTAIEWAKQRFPQSKVDYQVADLFKLPAEWQSQFDFVLEIYTVQSLPQSVREKALQAIPPLLKTGGQLLLICGAREHDTIPEGPPWRISRQELTTLEDCGLTLVHEEDFVPDTGRRQFRMVYQK